MATGGALGGLGGAGEPPDGYRPGDVKKSHGLGKRKVTKKKKKEKKIAQVTNQFKDTSISKPKRKMLSLNKITDPSLREILKTKVQGPVGKRVGKEVVYRNPLQQAERERACIGELQQLLDRLRQDSSDKSNLFMKSVFSRHASLVCGIPQSQTSRGLKEAEEAYVKSIPTAASDLWRTGDKITIEQEGVVLQGPHPDAYDLERDMDTTELNGRFLNLLRIFYGNAGQGPPEWLPNDVNWETPEAVRDWVEQNMDHIRRDSNLCRFLRSCAQERFTGHLAVAFLLSVYRSQLESETPPPITAEMNTRALSFRRVFHPNHTHSEIIRIPVTVRYRGEDRELAHVDWTITIDYDARCTPFHINSNAEARL